MSYELVNRITVKKDGVYISSHSNNDTAPFHSHRIKSLSDIYFEKGELALDTALVELLLYNCELRGEHPSVQRFRKVFESSALDKLRKIKNDKIETRFNGLPEDVRTEVELCTAKTEEAKAFFAFEKDLNYQFCLAVAKLLPLRNPIPVEDLDEFYIIENDPEKDYGVSYAWWGNAEGDKGGIVAAPRIDLYKHRFHVSDTTTEEHLDDFESIASKYGESERLNDMLDAINQHMDWWMQAPLTKEQAQNIPQYPYYRMLDVLKAGFSEPRAIFYYT